ncbi:ABC transporter permease [Nocardioides sp. cx-173]|uniref:ABC transporter permease n=1 Tax=Nocardioides sp. cx-173 TaxID=2898796 RepID=UPI001E42C71C|nr:ABC transporter permease [Nocardioides sp. cx-173]MCD4524555.1 ABC transporter permease [Nocardioides sp. cx-173]UGB42960.1 ABC transporter permease [Nocardioides sp. cx-173]
MTDATTTGPPPEGEAAPPPASPEQPRRPERAGAAWLPDVTTTLAAIGLALVIGALLIGLSDEEAVEALPYLFSYPQDFFSAAGRAIWDSYSALVSGSVGDLDSIGTTLVRSAPLICAGLGVTLAFRAGLFNIGAQGQLVVGALFAGYVGFTWDLPAPIHIVAALLAGMIGGALWGATAGILKARTGAHEVITTIMLNYLATKFLLNYLLSKDAFQRAGSDNAQSPAPLDSAILPSLGTVHAGVALAFLAAVAVWWLIERSTFGFQLRAVGANADAARTAGMNVARVYTMAMLLAGLLAGLAATMNILGKGDSLSGGMAGTIGFDAITVALLGRATPLGTVLAGLLFGALSVGGVAMQASAGTPDELAYVLQALIVLFVAAPALVRGALRMRGQGGATTVMAKGWGS